MKKVSRLLMLLLLIFMFAGLVSCEWFSNPDDNSNRPDDTEGARWGQSYWGDSKWN